MAAINGVKNKERTCSQENWKTQARF